MAEGSSYPAIIVDENGDQTAGNTLQFLDDSDQPSTGPPFSAASSGDSVLWKDTPDGDPIIDFDADSSTITLSYQTAVTGGITTPVGQPITAGGTLDGSSLGPTIPYLFEQAGAPDPIDTYLSSPLVYDSTAVTGGLYAWDGTQYQKIGNLVS